MRRGLLVALVLGVTGFFLVRGFGPLGNFGPEGMRDVAISRLAQPTTRGPMAVPGEEADRLAPRTEPAPPGYSSTSGGETTSAPVSAGPAWSPRLAARIATLVQCQNLDRIIEKYARQYGVDEELVWAVIRQESGFNPQAVSPKGAMGLMQLMPGTAALMGVSDAFDVEQNIAGGVKYLERCLSRFNQDVGLALAAYNAGPENVVKYQGCPPFAETRQYVVSILQAYAGESMREGMKLIGVSLVQDQDMEDSAHPRGLLWRIPPPAWRIAKPHCKLGAPRWKVALRPF